jgi:amidase
VAANQDVGNPGVGFKPTHGLVPYTGIASGDAVNDHAGPLARSVADVALCLDAISGYDGIDDRSLASPKHGSTHFASDLETESTRLLGWRVGILTEGFEHAMVDPAVKQSVMAAAHKFVELGARVEMVSLPEHLNGPAIWTIQQRVSGSLNMLGLAHGRRGLYLTEMERARLPWTTESFQRAFPSTQNVIINGMYLSSQFPDLYCKASNITRQLRDLYEGLFDTYDVVVMPTTPVVAPKHGQRGGPIESIKPSMGLTINTAIFDLTGHPAMSIPVGFAPSNEDPQVSLPVGMQIVGGLWKESKVLRAGHAWETHFDWKKTSTDERKHNGVLM